MHLPIKEIFFFFFLSISKWACIFTLTNKNCKPNLTGRNMNFTVYAICEINYTKRSWAKNDPSEYNCTGRCWSNSENLKIKTDKCNRRSIIKSLRNKQKNNHTKQMGRREEQTLGKWIAERCENWDRWGRGESPVPGKCRREDYATAIAARDRVWVWVWLEGGGESKFPILAVTWGGRDA